MADGDLKNLVLLPIARDDDEAPIIKDERPPWCAHRKTRLDAEARRLYCRDCGREVEPIDFLLKLSRERERWVDAYEQALARAKKAQRELEDVERRLRNAKARLRRAQQDSTVEERLADGR